MRLAQVFEWGHAPKLVEAPEPPSPGPDEIRLKVKAVGIHRVVRSRAAGEHYSTAKTSPPHTPGVDGVGETEDGKSFYWFAFGHPSLSEYVNIPKHITMELPPDANPIQTAAAVNPGLSSWMALNTRTNNLPPDFTVLILGATSASGRLAPALARTLGAKTVIGAARNKAALESLDGLDQRIVVAEEDPTKTDFSSLGDVDVILDYVYGPLLIHLFQSLKSSRPVQYVQIGSLSAVEVALPSSILRSKNLTLRGSGPGAWTMKEASEFLPRLVATVGSFPELPVRVAKVEDVEKVWNEEGNERLVITF